MSKNIEQTLAGIDMTLENLRVIHISEDLRRRLEEEIWAGLNESVQMGWFSQEEAEEMFIEWRRKYLGIEE